MSAPRPGGPLPLSCFEQLHTVDVDEARHVVAEAFCPHRLTPADAQDRFETRFHAVRTGDVSLCYLDYGGRVHIAPHEQETFYLVLIPLAGRAELTHGREYAQYDAGGASIPPVDRPYRIDVSAGSPHFVVRIARDRLEEHLRATLDRPVNEPVRFDLRMDMTTPATRSWRDVLDLMLREVDGDTPTHPLIMRHTEQLLLSHLLISQSNNYSPLLHAPSRGTAPKAIRRAAALIELHAAEPLTVMDVATATGMSVRSLQDGFQRHLDTTPTSYLREVRLRHVHEELAAADPFGTSVTEVAGRWGFFHLSRFADQYRRRFGELPSDTLRRGRVRPRRSVRA